MPTLDDDLKRLADGDRAPFTRVFQTLWPVLARYCERALGDAAEGEDAAQQAIEKIFTQLDRYDPERSAWAWALAIAAWECRTLRRKRQRRRAAPLEAAGERGDEAPSPEEAVSRADLIRALREVVATLGEGDRTTLELAFSDALEGGATFRKRKQRALARLREAFRRIHES